MMPRRLSPSRPYPWLVPLLLAASAGAQNTPGSVLSQSKVSDTEGGFLGTLDDGDRFGASVANLGDVNGDGVDDLAVGAPLDDDGGTDRGAVWLLFLAPDGTVDTSFKISSLSGGFLGELSDGDNFGASLAGLGDIDGDEIPDLAVGAPKTDDGGDARGAVWILLLSDTGTVRGQTKISNTSGGFSGGLDDNDEFGTSLATIGDLDGNAVADLAVGVPKDDDGMQFAGQVGAVWIVFLGPTGTAIDEQKISAIVGGFTGVLEDLDQFGIAVAPLGDIDGDTLPDLAVGAFGDDDGGANLGAVWVLFLRADGTVGGSSKISQTAGGFSGTLDTSDAFGISLARLGDVDGNQLSDLAVGVLRDDGAGTRRGAVWVLYLDDDGTVKGQARISDDTSFGGVLDDDDQFGTAIAPLGDFDGDDAQDIVVGAQRDDDGGPDRGAIWVCFLDGRFVASVVPRDGMATNPSCLSAPQPPVMGEDWNIIVGVGMGGQGGPTFLIATPDPLEPSFQIALGEILVDLFSSPPMFVETDSGAPLLGVYELPIPNDPDLAGLSGTMQALRTGPPAELCNAVDFVLGFEAP